MVLKIHQNFQQKSLPKKLVKTLKQCWAESFQVQNSDDHTSSNKIKEKKTIRALIIKLVHKSIAYSQKEKSVKIPEEMPRIFHFDESQWKRGDVSNSNSIV